MGYVWASAPPQASSNVPAPKPPSLSCLALGLGIVLLFAWRATSYGLLADDAFITFRYADHLAQGFGLSYNPGERVEGTSSLLWTLLLAGGSRIGLAPPDLAPVLGVLCGVMTLVAVHSVARRLLGATSGAALVGAATVAINPSFTFWAASGMETVCFGLLLLMTWALACSRAAEQIRGAALLAVLAALLGLARPEGLAAAVLLPLGLALRRVGRRALLVVTTLLVGFVAVELVWRLATFGALLPNPVYAKVAPTSAAVRRGLGYLWGFLNDDGVLWLVPLVLLARYRSGRVASLAAVLLGYTTLVVLAGGDGLYRHRLMAHVMPLVALLTVDGLARLQRMAPRGSWGASVLLVGAMATPLFERGFFRDYPVEQVRAWEERWDAVGRALRVSVPHDAVLASNVAGRVPYRSRLRTIDLLGLTDPIIALSPVTDFGKGYAGHERARPDYVLARRPDLVYLSVLDGMPPALSCSSRASATVLRTGSLFRYTPLFENRDFLDAYAPASLVLATGERATLFARRDLRPKPGRRLVIGSWCDAQGR